MTIKTKQLLIFSISATAATIGIILFFFISSNKKPKTKTQTDSIKGSSASIDGFLGEKGKPVNSINNNMYIDETEVSDGNMHAFNYYSELKGKTIYFFIIKASDGTYRAAANACEVCHGTKKGFKQVGDLIRCENCRITYSKDSIALQKGGCNPGPISSDVLVENGKLIISQQDVENVAYLF